MATVSKYTTAKGERHRTPEGRQTDKRGFVTKAAAETAANVVEVDKLEGKSVAVSLDVDGLRSRAGLVNEQDTVRPFPTSSGIDRHSSSRYSPTGRT